jgi:hypothetical protein
MYSVNSRAAYFFKKYGGKTASSAEINKPFHLAKILQSTMAMQEVLLASYLIPLRIIS